MDTTKLKYMNEFAASVRLFTFPPDGLTEQQIEELEVKYNFGNHFPLALREYLLLAGGGSPIIETNASNLDELQQRLRGYLVEYNQQINRPFLAFENWNGCEYFLFIYGDDTAEDPLIWMAYLEPNDSEPNFLSTSGTTLTEFVNEKISWVKRGLSPF
ncbi:MAG: SMI1/KNR4 family protein [Bacteroidia bacterium]